VALDFELEPKFEQIGRTTITQTNQMSFVESIRWRWHSLSSRVPMSKGGLVKVLLVLAYAQMLIQQMDNRNYLQEQVNLLERADLGTAAGCCGGAKGEQAARLSRGAPSTSNGQNTEGASVADWFNCMWTSAQACSSSKQHYDGSRLSKAAKLFEFARDSVAQVLTSLVGFFADTCKRLIALLGLVWTLNSVWLARWRSPIVQRLLQSVLVQVYYVVSLLTATGEQADY